MILVDDILIGNGNADEVRVYAGGAKIESQPSFIFHKPFQTSSTTFGQTIVNVGDINGYGYNSLLVTDPESQDEGYFGGSVFLFPMQKGLQDKCEAYASWGDYQANFGTTAIAVGDMNGDGLADFFVGADADSTAVFDGIGRIIAFLGDPSYGSPIVVKEPSIQPQGFALNQNYPNPFSSTTNISFSITDARLYGEKVTLKIYNMLGKEIYTAYSGIADDFAYTIRVNAAGLPEGNYFYRLICANRQQTKMFSILH